MNSLIFVFFIVIGVGQSISFDKIEHERTVELVQAHRLSKRFINPSSSSGEGGFATNYFTKMRTKRNAEEECEKLELCKLHARSHRNFVAAFQLYFVNKENARLWDHHEHSLSECEQRYRCN